MKPAGEAGEGRQGQYLTFMIGREMLAMRIVSIREIIEYHPPTEVPLMPLCIRGVINLRGSVVPVVDLAVRLGLGSTSPGRRTCIVIVEIASQTGPLVLGLIVDSVSEVMEIPADAIQPPPAFGASVETQYIQAMARVNDRFMILLDVERVLTLDALQQARDVAPAA